MSTMTVEKWYGESLVLPKASHPHFRNFVVSAMGIVSTIVRERLQKEVRIRFMRDGTAAADPENHTIYINQNYMQGKVPFTNRTLCSSEIITLLLGLFVHESAHFTYSYKDLTNYTGHIQSNTTRSFNESIAASVGNIVEDVFIEAEIDRRVPSLFWMLERTNEMFFPEEGLKEKLFEVSEVEFAPKSMQDVAKVLDMLIYAKTRDSVVSTPYICELFELTRSAVLPYTLEEREALALQVYDRLMENCKTTGSLEESDIAKKALEDSSLFGSRVMNEEEGCPVRSDIVGVNGTEIALDDLRETLMTREENSEIGQEGKVCIFTEKLVTVGSHATLADTKYATLSELGRQIAVVNRPYGQDRNRGSHIRKLHRIATDGKIFAESIPMKDYKPMQVLLLMDCSGSMMELTGGGVNRIQATGKATLGAALALLEARCDVAVYGHTADIRGMDDTHIYRVKGFNESSAMLAEKIFKVTDEEMHSNNRDGHAIRYLGRKFTKPNYRRVMIVISDGQPAAASYGGFRAIEHTEESVNLLRQQGIEVLSISISREAREPNDMIYGHQWNVYNEDVNVVEQIIRKLIVN